MKYELQDLIQGKGGDGKTNFIRKITDHLRTSKGASFGDETKKYTKQQEEEILARVY